MATGRSPWLLAVGTTSLFTVHIFSHVPRATVMRGIYVLIPVCTRRTCTCHIDLVNLEAFCLYLNHFFGGNLLVSFAHF